MENKIEPNYNMKDRILRHLKDFGSITTWSAIEEYGCTRLGQYILLLKKDGLNIQDEWIKSTNRYGEKIHFKRYWIEVSE